jgi:hypothetical protein
MLIYAHPWWGAVWDSGTVTSLRAEVTVLSYPLKPHLCVASCLGVSHLQLAGFQVALNVASFGSNWGMWWRRRWFGVVDNKVEFEIQCTYGMVADGDHGGIGALLLRRRVLREGWQAL